ncbi:MAG: 2-hydroxychromene-2-carboxylate isomerase [Rhizobiales bacterium]|nr:2-hydroxychromene-2-carboxylate isomerase [Hyphomicrobiales bacterium]NRB14715.1 2-hydroxychromene-2-carboxylate isomerase [Hyphomicrobiales bacterium]
MTNKIIEFWFDFASTYSYLTAERIEAMAESNGLVIAWKPFLLGPIFKSNGLVGSPFTSNKPKRDYMWRDIQRSAKIYKIPFISSTVKMPQNSLLAARVALCLDDGAQRAAFTRQVYRAQFAHGKDIAELATLADILANLGHQAAEILVQTQAAEIKQQLFANTADAQTKGIFGAPSVITQDGELFWGNDRLEDAMAWAVK